VANRPRPTPEAIRNNPALKDSTFRQLGVRSECRNAGDQDTVDCSDGVASTLPSGQGEQYCTPTTSDGTEVGAISLRRPERVSDDLYAGRQTVSGGGVSGAHTRASTWPLLCRLNKACGSNSVCWTRLLGNGKRALSANGADSRSVRMVFTPKTSQARKPALRATLRRSWADLAAAMRSQHCVVRVFSPIGAAAFERVV